MGQCPCGSTKEYAQCCEVFIKGKAKAPTAEALMRSRYSAFAVGELDYVQKTHHPDTRAELDMDGVKSWALNSTWQGLEILATEAGGQSDLEGSVEFKCRFHFNDADQVHHELSSFKKENGEWFFVDGVLRNNTYKRQTPKVGRNDPCPCGSGKKAKKCCLQ